MRRFASMMLLSATFLVGGCVSKPHTAADDQAHLARLHQRDVQADAARLAGERGHNAHEGAVSQLVDTLASLPRRVYNEMTGRKANNYARMMENPDSADDRRIGVLKLGSYPYARVEPYTRRYRQIAFADTNPLVKAAALRNLNRSRDKQAGPIFLSALNDKDPLVRLEAAKGIANIPDKAAIASLIAHLNADESRDVRIACADALREYRQLDVSRALVSVLLDKDFGVAWQARHSLSLMTGRDFRYDEGAWLGHLSQQGNPFE